MKGEHEVEFYQDKREKWRWRKRAPNGRIVLSSSQGYEFRGDCWRNFESECLCAWRIAEDTDDG